MEKLIELLDTFEKERVEKLKSDVWKNDTISPRVWSVNDVKIYEKLRVISKEMGFIQWLVDNDKIEFREDFYLEDQHGGGFGEDENIIMILSIQDDAIGFLISLLK